MNVDEQTPDRLWDEHTRPSGEASTRHGKTLQIARRVYSDVGRNGGISLHCGYFGQMMHRVAEWIALRGAPGQTTDAAQVESAVIAVVETVSEEVWWTRFHKGPRRNIGDTAFMRELETMVGWVAQFVIALRA